MLYIIGQDTVVNHGMSRLPEKSFRVTSLNKFIHSELDVKEQN